MDRMNFLCIFLFIFPCVAYCGEDSNENKHKAEIISFIESVVSKDSGTLEKTLPVKNEESVKNKAVEKRDKTGKIQVETQEGVKSGKEKPLKVMFASEGIDVSMMVRNICRSAGLNIVIDRSAIAKGVEAGTVRTTVTLKVDNMKLRSALNWICRLAGLAWTLQDEAIFISTPDRIKRSDKKMRIYDIRDLTMQVQDFPGPNIELVPGEPDIIIR